MQAGKVRKCRTCNEVNELLSEIQDSTDVALTVLNDLLNYDKIEMGNLRIEVRKVAIWKMVQNVVNSFALDAKTRKVKLSISCDVDNVHNSAERTLLLSHLFVNGDVIRLGQVVRNLVSNAVKFSLEGNYVIVAVKWVEHGLPSAVVPPLDQNDGTLHMSESDYNTANRMGSILISIHDTGPGISFDNQKKLFEQGRQFNVNQLQSGGGSGLGLFISKGIVELHHGKIWAESQTEGEGKGSTFFVELPVLHRPMSDADDPNTSLGSSSSTSGRQLSSYVLTEKDERKSCKILVVDDSLPNRKMLTKLLSTRGYSCVTASDGKECVDIILGPNGHEFDCILLDNHMPEVMLF